MRWRALAISFVILMALPAICSAQQTDYSGTAKLVLKLEKMPDMPAMPENPAQGLVPTTYGYPVGSGSTSAFDQTNEFAEYAMPAAPQPPAVPQGTILQATVLYSSDPAIQNNSTYQLKLDYDTQSMPYGLQSQLLDELNPGAIVGVNDYTLDGNTITVDAGTSLWKKHIFIVDSPGTTTGQSRNPFRMDLTFRPFRSFPDFTMNGIAPSANTTAPQPVPYQETTTIPDLQNTGFFDIVGRFLR